MGQLIGGFTMSLDGFIAKPDHSVGELFSWYWGGDVELSLKGTDQVFKVSQASVDLLTEEWSQFGAMVTGRRDIRLFGNLGIELIQLERLHVVDEKDFTHLVFRVVK